MLMWKGIKTGPTAMMHEGDNHTTKQVQSVLLYQLSGGLHAMTMAMADSQSQKQQGFGPGPGTSSTTVELYVNLLNLQRYTGIFPFNLERQEKLGANLGNISYHKTGKWAYLARALLVLTATVFLWEISALCLNLVFWKEIVDDFAFLMHISWIYNIGFEVAILITFAMKRSRICDILNEWMAVERELIQYGDQDRVRKYVQSQQRCHRLLIGHYVLTCILSVGFLTLTFVTMSSPMPDMHPMITFHIPSKTTANILFGVYGDFMVLSMWASTASMEVLMLSLCYSIRCALRVVRPGGNHGGGIGGDESTGFDWSVAMYKRLHGLVRRFNASFAWHLLLYKATAFTLLLLIICNLIVTSSSYETSSIPILIGLYASLFIRFTAIMVSMGAVRAESVQYQDRWLESAVCLTGRRGTCAGGDKETAAWTLTRDQREIILWTVRPIEFRVGNFYSIVPSSILTFCWIFETYVIVVLQLLYVK